MFDILVRLLPNCAQMAFGSFCTYALASARMEWWQRWMVWTWRRFATCDGLRHATCEVTWILRLAMWLWSFLNAFLWFLQISPHYVYMQALQSLQGIVVRRNAAGRGRLWQGKALVAKVHCGTSTFGFHNVSHETS